MEARETLNGPVRSWRGAAAHRVPAGGYEQVAHKILTMHEVQNEKLDMILSQLVPDPNGEVVTETLSGILKATIETSGLLSGLPAAIERLIERKIRQAAH